MTNERLGQSEFRTNERLGQVRVQGRSNCLCVSVLDSWSMSSEGTDDLCCVYLLLL